MFLFLSLSCDFLVVQWAFPFHNVVTLEIRFSCFPKVFWFFFFFNYFYFYCCRLSLCRALAWGVNIISFWVFPGYMLSVLNFPQLCSSGSEKGKKQKNEGGKGNGSLSPLQVTSASGGRYATTMAATSLSAPLWSDTAVSDENTGSQDLEGRVLFGHLSSHMLCAGCSKNM